jgi:hypothetical protein
MKAKLTTQLAFAVLGWLSTITANAAPVSGEAISFESPNGLTEQCIRLDRFPGAHYKKHDDDHEAEYCALDFSLLALCPKLWSTSPGTILYDIDAAAYGGDYRAFETQHCASGHHAKDAARHKPATFKISVNDRDTSATYAPSSWVYYHFSRYFRTQVHVPVSVYRSMDAAVHHDRVVKPALSIVGDRRSLRMLAAGWRFLDKLETGQLSGGAAHAALTDEGRQVYGVLLDNKGDRYGAEFNGTRESGWGSGQNLDFQQTAPYLALRSELPVMEAARWGIHEARKNPKMAKALPAETDPRQVVFWMQELLEITLLDFMLGQQDRIGNIDYNWRWYWIEDGKLESDNAHGKEPPQEIAGFSPVRLRQSAINDNDAGVRAGYADFAERTHMLEGLRHYNADLYRRLGAMAADFQAKGEMYRWMTNSAGLSTSEADRIAGRTIKAFELLQADCRSGGLALDLEPAQALDAGLPVSGKAASCDLTD